MARRSNQRVGKRLIRPAAGSPASAIGPRGRTRIGYIEEGSRKVHLQSLERRCKSTSEPTDQVAGTHCPHRSRQIADGIELRLLAPVRLRVLAARFCRMSRGLSLLAIF